MRRSWTRAVRAFFADEGEGGRGQALAEFAIAFPLQLFVTFGLMQVILLYISTLMVNFASYRACRAALVGEDPRRAAQIVLAPLAGRHLSASDRAAVSTVTIPGWGELEGSDLAYAKALAWEVESEDPEDRLDRTVVVEFDQELMFPIVDRLFAAMLGGEEAAAEGETVFGEEDLLFDPEAYLDREPAYDPETHDLKPGRKRIRKIDGAYHFLIVRECTMYRQQAANYREGGEIDIGIPTFGGGS